MAGFLSRVPGEAMIVLGMCAAASTFGTYTLFKKATTDKDVYYMPQARKEVEQRVLGAFNGKQLKAKSLLIYVEKAHQK